LPLPLVTLIVVSNDSKVLRAQTLDRSIDLALLFEEDSIPGVSRITLFRQRLFLLHTDEAHRTTASVMHAEAAQWPLIVPNNGRRAQMNKRFESAGVKPNIVAETQDLASMLAAVREPSPIHIAGLARPYFPSLRGSVTVALSKLKLRCAMRDYSSVTARTAAV
jgi:hypothetical protein